MTLFFIFSAPKTVFVVFSCELTTVIQWGQHLHKLLALASRRIRACGRSEFGAKNKLRLPMHFDWSRHFARCVSARKVSRFISLGYPSEVYDTNRTLFLRRSEAETLLEKIFNYRLVTKFGSREIWRVTEVRPRGWQLRYVRTTQA